MGFRGTLPYGWRLVNHVRVKDEEEQRVLEIMLKYHAADYPYRLIAKALNERGFVTRKGQPWAATSVHYVIRGVTTTGSLVFKPNPEFADFLKQMERTARDAFINNAIERALKVKK